MHKLIVTLLALLFSVTGCSFTLASSGGWGADGPAPLVASRGHGASFNGDSVRHGFGKPARRVDADRPAKPPKAKKPAIEWAGEVPTKMKKPAIEWAGEVPKKMKQPAIEWVGEAPTKAKQPAITWAGKVPEKQKQPAIDWAGKVPAKLKKTAKKPAKQPEITWAGTVPPVPQ
ncbi:hypothetical protein [Nannocystis sp. SCPEA4]|uniref:hypothetical protein n=1 Tax=Nannocystis sp. SCPEA4 TaxID=2996787 RepID=UPI0022715F97|nr:hypothetical protein [Nannocystis sp. SCPEA4]MCY1053617.1 hypothetical protein [Nannocystis sp. SCPEA4]